MLELVAYTDEAGERCLRESFARVETTVVADGWEDAWKRFHRPARIGSLWVGPPWETSDPDALPVVIDPGRAFGTGGHATTRLCLELLHAVAPGSLLDVGCGSGVLAIAAAKLGFAPVVALDVDEAAVEATSANAAANGVDVDVRLVDALAETLPAADVAVANITLAAAEVVAERLPASRALVLSGYLADARLDPRGWQHARRLVEGGWAADLYARERRT